ncbi:hypothetical protein GLYMA_09G185300v4 [Glycine max]|uniref:Uncharacterized protein n=2 Tax=Glycine subgen. Soja TaxID=1462606 RepID=C6T290_SOYBN|nr:uncharacterized protein LOC100500608 [Glycine max]XP_028181896.1 uncharacterized protein LOC114368832 [Glycine soja]ACU15734.1 unknown [Glycine max]KAG4388498.1 hypothetical protein GLYMA_09G185300v4 [Glycine max]KAH1043641.1 hypothetical protein GYH30_025472 [Glycine max]|eukprot:NP_001236747.1 uncharacterized protein LOC100500608 [Glycine max]
MAFTVASGSGVAIIPCGNTGTAALFPHRTRRNLHVARAKKPLNGDDVSVYAELLKAEVSVLENNKPLDDNDAALKFLEKIDRQFQQPDLWEGPQWDWLGIFIKFSPIIGIAVAASLAIYGCFTFHEPPKNVREAAERLYSVQSGVESNAESDDVESSAETDVESSAESSSEVFKEPDAYDSDVFDSNPTEVAPSLE